MPEKIEGQCFFYSETGTEGGYWAVQDKEYITKNVITSYCKKCGKWLEPQENEKIQVTKVLLITQEVLDGEEPPECPEGQHERDTQDLWSYEGLHVLENGDDLTIYDKEPPHMVVWEGVINLIELGLFTDVAFGFWIHNDQKGMEREKWAKFFLEENPCTLIKKNPQ